MCCSKRCHHHQQRLKTTAKELLQQMATVTAAQLDFTLYVCLQQAGTIP